MDITVLIRRSRRGRRLLRFPGAKPLLCPGIRMRELRVRVWGVSSLPNRRVRMRENGNFWREGRKHVNGCRFFLRVMKWGAFRCTYSYYIWQITKERERERENFDIFMKTSRYILNGWYNWQLLMVLILNIRIWI